MPQKLIRFDASMHVNLTSEQLIMLKALSWVKGLEGKASSMARHLFLKAAKEEIASMTPEERAEYDGTLSNLQQTAAQLTAIAEESPQENENDGRSPEQPSTP